MVLYKIKNIILLSSVCLCSSNAFSKTDMLLTTSHLQNISIEFISSTNSTIENGVLNTSHWVINSNNAISVAFSGSSPEGSSLTNIPRFYKQRVNAKNQLINEQYDYLDTKFGGMFMDIDSTEKGTLEYIGTTKYSRWASSILTNATPEILIDESHPDSPNMQWGAIMPTDNNRSNLFIYSRGTGTTQQQSGNYILNLNLVVTAKEVLNP